MNALNSAKEEYKDATHYCYSYIINNTERFNDDGEPGGTAGMPILNVLKQNELNYVLCIVIRYFGGIKLGAGGLVRAYTKSASECLNVSTLKELKIGFSIKISFDYGKVKLIDYTLNNIDIKDKTFEDYQVVEVAKGVRLLRFALVYGANASGKSNLLNVFNSFMCPHWTLFNVDNL